VLELLDEFPINLVHSRYFRVNDDETVSLCAATLRALDLTNDLKRVGETYEQGKGGFAVKRAISEQTGDSLDYLMGLEDGYEFGYSHRDFYSEDYNQGADDGRMIGQIYEERYEKANT
jgi:hypothetical protein